MGRSTYRDDPYDDWDWLGVFQRDSGPDAQGCLSHLPAILFSLLILGTFIAPFWTFYHIGKRTWQDKGCVVQGYTGLITGVALIATLVELTVGGWHVLMLALGLTLHNPLLTAMLIFSVLTTMLLAAAFAFGLWARHKNT